MIRKWRNRFIIYLLIAAFLTIIGIYFYLNLKANNDVIFKLKEEGTLVSVKMERLPNTVYSDTGYYYWGYNLPADVEHNKPEIGFDAATIITYSLSQYEEMGGMVEVYYLVYDNGNFVTYDRAYVDYYKPFDYFESIFLWIVAGISAAVAVYYLVRNIIYLTVAAKGVECIGRFEEAFHTKFGSAKYYKVKFSYTFNEETFTGITPAIYTGREVDKLKSYGTLIVKMLGKMTVIDHKFR